MSPEVIAAKYGLTPAELANLLRETDQLRGMVEPAEVGQAIEELARIYVNALGSAAARFTDPVESLVADRICCLAGELLAEQLGSVDSMRN